ncbi:hypothetical protein TNCV_3731891 [Trichonephila clavipes]|nr:hypothetical protein TNCV_3731891 [Trichonephila clavipes]
MSSSLAPLKTRRVENDARVKSVEAQTSFRWCSVVVRRGGFQLRCRSRHLTMVQNGLFPKLEESEARWCSALLTSLSTRLVEYHSTQPMDWPQSASR